MKQTQTTGTRTSASITELIAQYFITLKQPHVYNTEGISRRSTCPNLMCWVNGQREELCRVSHHYSQFFSYWKPHEKSLFTFFTKLPLK